MKTRVAWLTFLFAVSLQAADSVPLFNATLTVGREHRFVLVDSVGKASSFLALGESFAGFQLKNYDPKAGVLELERDGRMHRLTLVADAATKDAPAPAIPATIADAEAVLDAMHFAEMMDKTLAGIKKQQGKAIEGMMGQMMGPGGDKEAIVAFQKKMIDEIMSAMTGGDMKADVAKAYSEVFSKADLQGLANFYSSPLGQVFSDKQPVLAEKMNEIMMPRMMAVMPKVRAMAQEFGKEQKAKREAAGGVPAPKK